MVHLGNNISRLRGFRRLPQKDVAARLNLSQQDYSKLEAKAEIDDDLLERIAAIVDFPVDLIKELDLSPSVQNFYQQGGNAGHFNNSTFHQHPIDKLLEIVEENRRLYERLLKEKDDAIEMYKKQQKAS